MPWTFNDLHRPEGRHAQFDAVSGMRGGYLLQQPPHGEGERRTCPLTAEDLAYCRLTIGRRNSSSRHAPMLDG